jgi:hypothetical protein
MEKYGQNCVKHMDRITVGSRCMSKQIPQLHTEEELRIDGMNRLM